MAKKKKRVVLNLQQTRAKKDSSVIVDPDGREFELGGISVEAYLNILEFEKEFENMKEADEGSVKSQTELLMKTQSFVTAMLPGFNVDELYLDEIFAVFAAIQEGVMDSTGEKPEENLEGTEGNLMSP